MMSRVTMGNSVRKVVCALVVVLAVVAALSPVTASAAGGAPAWSINALSLPTNFVPGTTGQAATQPMYLVTVDNVGSESTDGSTYHVEVELPPSLPLAAEAEAETTEGEFLSCTSSGQVVRCEGSASLPPGELITMWVPVEVPANPTEPVVSMTAVVAGGGVAIERSTTIENGVSASLPSFDLLPGSSGASIFLSDPAGGASDQAGSHPYQVSIRSGFPSIEGSELESSGRGVKDIAADLPRGLVVNPEATAARCTQTLLENESCPPESQVGVLIVSLKLTEYSESLPFAVFNLAAPAGTPAAFGTTVGVENTNAIISGHVRSGSDYGLSGAARNIISKVPIYSTRLVLWGDPSAASHDHARVGCHAKVSEGDCPVEPTGKALLTMPSSCAGGDWLPGTISADSWAEPDAVKSRDVQVEGLGGERIAVSGCQALAFEPTISAQATSNAADSPTGLDFKLHQPQNEDASRLSPASLKDTTVTLPAGMTVNPASADGLEACTEQQIGYAPLEGKIRFDERAQTCSNGSKIGTMSVTTPLLDHALPGAVYLAKPYDNPFGSLLAIYLAVEDEESGVTAKLAGEVQTDPRTGRITAVFKENPELPLEDIKLHFFGGARAALQTPVVCGSYTTTSTLVPWSTPEGADAHPTSTFDTTGNPGSGPCPTQESSAPNNPNLSAGTQTATAAAYSPFLLKVTRGDGTQRIGKINATLPPGLTGKLAGVPYCSDADIAAAKEREKPNQGAEEISHPSCPLASEVGTVTVGAGAGPSPYYVRGHAYLAGPYGGAPISMVIITPAVAGPFDLGAVVVRTALHVDDETTQIHAVSDSIPSIIQGIPLDVRSIAVDMSRAQFTLNPTNCEPMAITGQATSTLGQNAALAQGFQVGGCRGLNFKPKLFLRLKGATKRSGHPALRAVLQPRQGDANISRLAVALPHSEFLAQSHIRTICTRVQFNEGAGGGTACPKGSIYGHVKAWSPLVDYVLEGPVILRSSSNPLPDLVAVVRGPANQPIVVAQVARIDSKRGGIRNTFEGFPDVPLSKAILQMPAGKKSLLENSTNICRQPRKAQINARGQNGRTYRFAQRLNVTSCKKGHKKPRGARNHKRH